MSRRACLIVTLPLMLSVASACTTSGGTPVTTAGQAPPTSVVPSTTTTRVVAPALLTRMDACAFEVTRGNNQGTVRLSIAVRAEEATGLTAGMAAPGVVPDDEWSGRLYFGSDLFSYYCTDVLDGSEPEPVEDEVWPMVGGTVEIVSLQRTGSGRCEARLAASRLVARAADDRRVELGDFDFVSGDWGTFPGLGGGVARCGDDAGA